MSESPWLAIIGTVFGTLVAIIGSLVLARLGSVSNQIDKNREEYKKEFTSIWESIKDRESKCSGIHSTISQDIGFIKAKIELILVTLSEQKKDLWDKADRQTALLMSEKDSLSRMIEGLEARIRDTEKEIRVK